MQCKDYVKFGVSLNPKVRVKELQTGNPFKINLLLSVKYEDHFGTEKKVHKYFEDKKESGEWFLIDDEVKGFVKYLKNVEYELSKRSGK